MSMARKARRKKRQRRTATVEIDREQTAIHEAAHAVVAVRLGLPLAYTDITHRVMTAGEGGPGTMASLNEGETCVSSGYTTLVEGTSVAWQKALPDPKARESLEHLGAECAAGIVAEMSGGAKEDDWAHRDDLYGVLQCASALGIGNSTEEEAVRDFISSRYQRAVEVLIDEDKSAAWGRVTAALLERERLSGDEVRDIVAEEMET